MKRTCDPWSRPQPGDPYIIEASDIGRKIHEVCTVKVIEEKHVGREIRFRDGKAWVESDAAYAQRTQSANPVYHLDNLPNVGRMLAKG